MISSNKRRARCSVLNCLNGVRLNYGFVTFSCSLKTSGAHIQTFPSGCIGRVKAESFLPCKEGVELDNPESLVSKT